MSDCKIQDPSYSDAERKKKGFLIKTLLRFLKLLRVHFIEDTINAILLIFLIIFFFLGKSTQI